MPSEYTTLEVINMRSYSDLWLSRLLKPLQSSKVRANRRGRLVEL